MYDGKTKGDIGMERTINVTGKGRIKVKPDLIRLLISMKGEFSDYEQTLQQSAEQTEELKKIFEDLGFQKTDLKTLYFNVDTQYENYQAQDKSWKHRFKGYQFTHRMKIEFPTDNEKLGKILYALAHCKTAPEFSIEYTVSDPETVKNELLGKAVRDSFAKAEILAKAGGVKLGKIIKMEYSWDKIDIAVRPMKEMALRGCESTAAETAGSYDINIEADDIDITDTVTLTWNIEDYENN